MEGGLEVLSGLPGLNIPEYLLAGLYEDLFEAEVVAFVAFHGLAFELLRFDLLLVVHIYEDLGLGRVAQAALEQGIPLGALGQLLDV